MTNEEKLYMLFHEDYDARQIFEFLRVETVKDLEQFSPEQIVQAAFEADSNHGRPYSADARGEEPALAG